MKQKRKRNQYKAGSANSNNVLLEWRIDDSEAVWRPTDIQTAPTPAPLPKGAVWLQRSLLLSLPLLLLLIAGGWKWHLAQVDRVQAQADISGLVSGSKWSANSRVEMLAFHNDQALARVFVQTPFDPIIYRQTRVFRQSAEGWQPAPPFASLWGRVQRLETPYFVFIYRAADAVAIAEAAAQLDRLYPHFFASFFAAPPLTRKVSITIDPEIESVKGAAQGQDQLLLPSPAIHLVPDDLSETTILIHAISTLLLDKLAKEAVKKYSHPPYAQSFAAPLYYGRLTDAVRLWQLSEIELPAHLWQSTNLMDDPFIVENAQEICALHQAQRLRVENAPAASQSQGDPCPGAWQIAYVKQLRLSQVMAFIPLEVVPGLSGETQQLGQLPHPAATVALATLLEYAATTFGPEKVALLLAQYGSYHSWEGLIPAVFGLSAGEFEAGWQGYVATHHRGQPEW